MTLHHIEINVNDLKKSRDFYAWLLSLLGYSLHQDWPQGFSYKKDASYLVFVQTEERFLKTIYHRKNTGLNHLAFHATTQQIEEVHQYCLDHQIPLLYEDRYPHAGDSHSKAVFFEDPDRIKIELSNE